MTEMRTFWLAAAAFLSGFLATIPSAAAAFAFCVVHPLNPLCCPSPCPVSDPAKTADLAGQAGQAVQAVERCRAMVQTYADLTMSVGTSLGQELRKLPNSVAAVVSSDQAAAPGLTGTLAEPRAVAEMLKQALFDPDGAAAPQMTTQLGKTHLRAELTAEQTAATLSSGLSSLAGLGNVARDGAAGATQAAKTSDLRNDAAANGLARQSLLETVSGFARLAGEWAALQGLTVAETHPASLAPLASPLPAGASSDIPAAPVADDLFHIGQLRQIQLTLNQMDGILTRLTAMHNQRYAANLMLAQVAGLQKTIDSHSLAAGFRDDDTARAGKLLAQLYDDGDAAFNAVAVRLKAIDQTSWLDSAAKTQAAADAAQAVIQEMTANPPAFGKPLANAVSEGGTSVGVLGGEMANVFAAWLEDDKLERLWRPLGETAQAAMGRLEGHLSDLSRRDGFDIANRGAVQQEQALLNRLQQNIGQLAIFDSRDFSPDQVTTVRAFVSAFQKVSGDVLADPQAQRAVAMVTPR